MSKELLIFGVGNMGELIAKVALTQGYRVLGTTRNSSKVAELEAAGIEPVDLSVVNNDQLAELATGKQVLVTVPPNPATDKTMPAYFKGASSIVYISATTVYGGTIHIDESTVIPPPRSHYAAWRLEAEASWRTVGAITLRVPGFYGAGWGPHEDLRLGMFRLPGDGRRKVSLIHVEDLSQIILAALDHGPKGETFVVCDSAPVEQVELISWLCEQLKLPMVDSIPIEQVHFSMLADRQVDSSKVLKTLGVTLKYPTYKEGFSALIADQQ